MPKEDTPKAATAATPMRPLWHREPCWTCGTEGQATRTRATPESMPYICEGCEATTDAEARAAAEIAELRELVRAAQHHIPRTWPQWGAWSAAAWRTLGPDFAISGSADYCPDIDEGANS